MKNTVNASIEFHFKGELYSAAAVIDLGQLVERQVDLSTLHHMLATEAKIDQYSYQYEMLLAEEIRFSDAQGIVAQHVHDGRLDIPGFKNAYWEHKRLNQLQSIAKRLLDIDDLGQQPALKNALLEAFQAGSDSTNKHHE